MIGEDVPITVSSQFIFASNRMVGVLVKELAKHSPTTTEGATERKLMAQGNKPIHRINLKSISAAVFANTSGEGNTFYSVQFDRSYRDGEEWKRTKSFGRDDLLLLSKAADMAHTWIHEQESSAPAGQSPEPS